MGDEQQAWRRCCGRVVLAQGGGCQRARRRGRTPRNRVLLARCGRTPRTLNRLLIVRSDPQRRSTPLTRRSFLGGRQSGAAAPRAMSLFGSSYQSGFLSLLYSIGSKPLSIWGSEGGLLSGGRLEGCGRSLQIGGGVMTRRGPPAKHVQEGSRFLTPRPALHASRRPLLAVENGHIKRLTDEDIQSSVLEVAGANVSTAYITCPADPAKTLGIKLPFLVMIVKNLNKYFTFEVTVLDDKNVRRRFRASNYQVRGRAVALRGCWPCRADRRRISRFSGSKARAGACADALRTRLRNASHLRWCPLTCPPCLALQSTTRVKPFICTMPMRLDEGWNQVRGASTTA